MISTGALLGSSAISAGAGLVGGLTSASSSRAAARDAVQMQMDWEYLRAHNAHQWEMEDLKKAGLNPILAAGGSGAVTGGISAPVPDQSGYASAGQAVANAVNDFVNNKKIEAETALMGEQAANTRQDTLNKFTENGLIQAQQQLTLAKLGLIPFEQAKAKAEATIKEVEAKWAEAGKISELARNYANAIGSIIGAGGISAMAISKIAKGFNKVGKGDKTWLNESGIQQGPWQGNYLQ